MGVSSTQNRVALAGNGISTSFGFPYYFFSKSDLIVLIYDTLAGGVTGPLILNTDYTISGAQNFQGLFQSGANVVFSSYVPLITDIVIIVRAPIEQQNYSLGQGATISSAAIVQQFDYLILLVQRLEDQVTRCIQLPDGMGEPFAGQLPSTIALSSGSVPAVNPAGNGWILTASNGGTNSTITDVGDANYQVLPLDQYVRSTTPLTADRVWTMPPAALSNKGQKIIFKNLASQIHNIILAGNGGDLIEGLGSVTLAPSNSASLICGAAGQWDAF